MRSRGERARCVPLRKHFALIMGLMLAVLLPFTAFIQSAAPVYADSAPKRVINLVYDDSGSMINIDGKRTEGTFVDTWCQAKYALEVFAGMLGENDEMYVFYMNDFMPGGSGQPGLHLVGSDGPKVNVDKVHQKVTPDSGTPFRSVEAASEHLQKQNADEKWLVILTDGSFESPDMTSKEVSDYLNGTVPKDINVMFLGMGAGAVGITPASDNVFYEKAETNDQILQKLTDIGTQVFNRDRLKIDKNTVTFDIPMKELIVFAQGEKVDIKGISGDGGSFSPGGEPVTVQYTKKENATSNSGRGWDVSKIKEDKSLRGSIATLDGPIPEGDYKLDVSGAKTVEVYYTPDVDVIVKVKKGDEEVTDLAELEAGDYTVDFDIVKAGTEESVSDSPLLGGKVTYEATIDNNGKKIEGVKSGDTITIEEGPLSIDATAHYLGYHTVNTHLDYSIFKNKGVEFKVVSDNKHEVSSKGLAEDDQPTQIEVTVNEKTPTAEEWSQMDVPKVRRKGRNKDIDYKFEKSDTPGVYNVTPVLTKNGKPSIWSKYKDNKIRLEYEGQVGSATWTGESDVVIPFDDKRPFPPGWIIIGLVLLALLILILGYVPGIKHYLPRKLKRRPLVKSKIIGSYMKPPKPTNGQFDKKRITTFIPYVAEKGTIRYVPKGIAGAPKLQVKGAKGGRMEVTNIKDYAKKKNIQFDGERADRLIEDLGNKKKFIASSGLTMTSEINGVKYTCSLNE